MSRKSGETSVFPKPVLTTALLITELCGLYLLEWPLLLNFNKFAFWDWGGYLVAHYFVRQGNTPVVDFGWQYGLLPLFLQELWFRITIASPASFIVLSFLCALLFTIAIARFVDLERETAGRVLLFLTFPFIVAAGADPPHALEPALLSAGLLLQARGKRAHALAFAAAASFTKPVMAYLYGLVLLILVVADLHRQGKPKLPGLARALLPAICIGLSLALLLGTAFGWMALVRSLIPFAGAHAYRLLHYGWNGIARGLFYFPGIRPAYYVGTPITFLLCATLYLIGATALAGWRTLQSRRQVPAEYEIALTCALLLAGFLVFFYGSPSSWTYYSYILVIGVVATAAWTSACRRAVWGLCIVAAFANYGVFKSSIMAWKTMTRNNTTAELFVSPAELVEWDRVTSMVKDENPTIFTWDGGAEVLFPWLRKPAGAFLVPGVATAREIGRKVQQLSSAELIIIPTIPELGNPVTNWPGPEFQTVFAGTNRIFEGNYFEVYERAKR